MKKIIVIISSILLFSCKNDINKESSVDSNFARKISDKGSIEFEFDFPDTVKINKAYNGKILFKGIFDTLTTNVMEEIDGKDRYIIYSLIKTKNIDYSFDSLKQIKLDTFGAIDNRTILLDDISFNKLGIHYIDGILNDHITIDTLKVPRKLTDKIRYMEKEIRITHKVVVVP